MREPEQEAQIFAEKTFVPKEQPVWLGASDEEWKAIRRQLMIERESAKIGHAAKALDSNVADGFEFCMSRKAAYFSVPSGAAIGAGLAANAGSAALGLAGKAALGGLIAGIGLPVATLVAGIGLIAVGSAALPAGKGAYALRKLAYNAITERLASRIGPERLGAIAETARQARRSLEATGHNDADASLARRTCRACAALQERIALKRRAAEEKAQAADPGAVSLRRLELAEAARLAEEHRLRIASELSEMRGACFNPAAAQDDLKAKLAKLGSAGSVALLAFQAFEALCSDPNANGFEKTESQHFLRERLPRLAGAFLGVPDEQKDIPAEPGGPTPREQFAQAAQASLEAARELAAQIGRRAATQTAAESEVVLQAAARLIKP